MAPLISFFTEVGNWLVLVLAGGALALAFGRRRLAAILVGFVAVVSVAIMVLPVDDWVSAPLEDRFPRPTLPPHIDGIVLLGGAVRMAMTEARGEVSLNSMAERITATLALAQRYPNVPVVISGGDTAPEEHGFTGAAATRTLLVADGVDGQRILLEQRSQNTWENALYSKDVANPKPGQIWVLVTSANHMPRAVGCFRHVGWQVLPYPVDYQSFPVDYHGNHFGRFDLDFGGNLESLDPPVHEWLGLVEYRLLGRIDSLFPGPAPSPDR